MNRVSRITFELKKHDKELYAAWLNGKICILRKKVRHEVYIVDGQTIVYAKPDKQLIWALTDNWKMTGNPVEWGLEAIKAKIYRHDVWVNESFIPEMFKGYEKDEESNNRKMDTEFEGFASEFRAAVKKDFGDVNTSTLKKTDLRRIKDGYRKQDIRYK